MKRDDTQRIWAGICIEAECQVRGNLSYSNMSQWLGAVRAGGRVRVRLTADNQVQVKAITEEIQPVIDKSDEASWGWSITPNAPGKHILHLSISVLEAETTAPLTVEKTFDIHIQVYETKAQRARSIAGSAWDFLISLPGAIGVLGAALATVFKLRKRIAKNLRRFISMFHDRMLALKPERREDACGGFSRLAPDEYRRLSQEELRRIYGSQSPTADIDHEVVAR